MSDSSGSRSTGPSCKPARCPGAPFLSGEWRAILAARGVGLLSAAGLLVSWLSVALAAGIALPFTLSGGSREEVIETSVVMALLVPILVSAQVLDERPAALVLTAGRRLHLHRLAWALAYVTHAGCGAYVVTLVAPVPGALVVVDALLLAAGVGLGVSYLGPTRGWIPTVLAVAAASAPGMLPWQVNILYVTLLLPGTAAAAILLVALCLTRYAGCGAQARPHEDNVW